MTEPAEKKATIHRSAEELVLLVHCAVGLVGILPFAAYRLLQGQWLIAAVDFLLVLIAAGLLAYVWRTRRIETPSLIFISLCWLGVWAVNHLVGPSLLAWLFPTIVASFFLLSTRHASIFSLAGLIALLFMHWQQMPVIQLATFAATGLLSIIIVHAFTRGMLLQRSRLAQLADVDALTGAGNRRSMEKALKDKLGGIGRQPRPMSLVLIDIDHFKSINDSLGHAKGDEFLRRLVQLITHGSRSIDQLYRFGGDEFVLLMDHCKGSDAVLAAQKLLDRIGDAAPFADAGAHCSMGVAEYRLGDTPESWLVRADDALYQAKQTGRAKVAVAWSAQGQDVLLATSSH